MDVFIFTRVILPLTTNSENKRSNDRNLSTISTVPKNLDWKKRPASGARPAKASEKHPAVWEILKPAFINEKQEKKWRNWTTHGKRFYLAWNNWR